MKDPGSFTVPCEIGTKYYGKGLCDLGASINLMPASVFRKLGIEAEMRPTSVTLQLADRSIVHPDEIIDNILLMVGKLIIPVDFVICDIEEDENIPIILGRPFLATSGALIDVAKGELTLRVNAKR